MTLISSASSRVWFPSRPDKRLSVSKQIARDLLLWLWVLGAKSVAAIDTFYEIRGSGIAVTTKLRGINETLVGCSVCLSCIGV